jgi:CBS-domain-containing membrane protein
VLLPATIKFAAPSCPFHCCVHPPSPQPALTDVVVSPLIVEEDGTQPLVFNFTLDKVRV